MAIVRRRMHWQRGSATGRDDGRTATRPTYGAQSQPRRGQLFMKRGQLDATRQASFGTRRYSATVGET